jgi:hypothetical protein
LWLHKWSRSPYINHFLQPDTIIPKLINPQSLNRYGYTYNNPVRYADPSGHRVCNEENCLAGNLSAKRKSTQKQDEDEPEYHSKSWLKSHLGTYHDCTLTYKQCFDDWGLGILVLSDGQQLNQKQLEELLRAVYYDLKMKDKGIPLFPVWPTRKEYDTPFWNPPYPSYVDPDTQQYVAQPRKDNRVCIGQDCYLRSDINYFAQGMWGAISGQTLEETIQTAADYKAIEHGEQLTTDTQYWITFGFNKVLEYDSINLMDTLQRP